MDLARVHVGTPATVTVVAYKDKVFNGQVDWVSGMLDPSTRTAKVRCTFDNPDRLLRPEMYATVADLAWIRRRALAIPRNALLRLGEYKVVFIEVGDEPTGACSFERVPVDVDEGEASQWLEVKHGLETGQKVVVNGRHPALAEALSRPEPRHDPANRRASRCACRSSSSRRRCSSSCSGSVAYKELDIEAYPNPVPPLVEVITQPAGWSAEEVERYVTIPLEIGLVGHAGARSHPVAVALRL